MNTITSVTRLPRNAFSSFRDVPSDQDNTYRKIHKCTTRGLSNAIKRIKVELDEYSESYGNGAVCSGWIEMPHGKIERDYASHLMTYKFGNATEMLQCMFDLNKIIKQLNDEQDKQDEQERQQMLRDYPLGTPPR